MQNILETKHKVMQKRIQKVIDTINFCYSNDQKEEKDSLFIIMQTIKRKYEQSFEKIINSNNINKSLKYKQLEGIVFGELAKIELQIQKEIIKKKDQIVQLIKEKYEQINYLDENWKEKIDELKDIFVYLKINLNNEQITQLEELHYEMKFIIMYKRMKNKYIDELGTSQTWYKELDGIENEELEIYSKYILEKYNEMLKVYNKKKKRAYPSYPTTEEKDEDKRIKRVEIIIENFINGIISKFNIIEKVRYKKKKQNEISLKRIPIEFFKDESLLRDFIELDLILLPSDNRFLLDKEIFQIGWLDIPKDCNQTMHINTRRKIDKVGIKILYYYISNIIEEKNFSIRQLNEMIKNVLKIDEFTIENLCFLEKNIDKRYRNIIIKRNIRISNINEQLASYSSKYEKKDCKYKCNILKINLEGYNYEPGYMGLFQTQMRYSPCRSYNIGCYPKISEELYEKYLKKDLQELGIWSKFDRINEYDQYEIYVNLEDINIPFDKEKVLDLQQVQKLEIGYLEAEKSCRESQLQVLEDGARLLLEDSEKKEILNQIYDIRNEIQNQNKPFEKQEQEKLTNLFNKIEGEIKSILKEKFESMDKNKFKETEYVNYTRAIAEILFPEGELAENNEEYFCEEIINRNFKLIDECNTTDEKIQLLERMKKAYFILGETLLDGQYLIEELYFRHKYKILIGEAVKNFLLDRKENVFWKYCTEEEIIEIHKIIMNEYFETDTILGIKDNYITDDLEKVVKRYLIEKSNWKFEYLELPIYELNDFAISKQIEQEEKDKFKEFIEQNKGKKYSILEIHKELQRIGMLDKVLFYNTKEANINTPKNWQYRIYEDTRLDEEMKNYLGEVDSKIKNNEDYIQYVKYSSGEDLYIRKEDLLHMR